MSERAPAGWSGNRRQAWQRVWEGLEASRSSSLPHFFIRVTAMLTWNRIVQIVYALALITGVVYAQRQYRPAMPFRPQPPPQQLPNKFNINLNSLNNNNQNQNQNFNVNSNNNFNNNF